VEPHAPGAGLGSPVRAMASRPDILRLPNWRSRTRGRRAIPRYS